MRADQQRVVDQLRSAWKFSLFTLSKLPTLWFWGIKVHELSEERCTIRLPFSWFTKNPFKSVYFAAQCGAAELSTGLLVISMIGDQQDVSMLVTGVQGQFSKKAIDTVFFSCDEGSAIAAVIEKARVSGQGETYLATAIGKMPSGEEVSRFSIQWSFKLKSKK